MGAMSKKDAENKVGGFWHHLFGKSSSVAQPKNLSLYQSLDTSGAQSLLAELKNHQKSVNKGAASWEEYYKPLSEGEKWKIDFIQNNDLQKATTDDLIAANNAACDSAIKYNNSLKQMTLGAKAGQAALKGLAIAGNMVVFALILKGIEAAAAAIDHYIHRIERSNEAMENAVCEYESAKSELESLNFELESNKQKIDELLSKDKLTYTEEGQLEKLQKITKELEAQQDIAEKTEAKSAKEAGKKTVDAYETQYGDYDISKEAINEELNDIEMSGHVSASINENDITGNIAQLIKYQELANETKEKLTSRQHLDANEIKGLEDDFQYYIDYIGNLNDTLDTTLADLSQKQQNLQPGYDDAVKKQAKGEFLTTSEKDIVYTYESTGNAIDLIHKYKTKVPSNSYDLSDVFSKDGVEKSQNELIQMANTNELTPETIEGYKNLNSAIEDSKILLEDGQTYAEAFCNQIYACAEASNNLNDSLSDKSESSFTNSLSKVQSLSQGLDQLNKIYADVSDKKDFDWSSILNNETFTNTFGDMDSVYDDFIKTVSKSPDNIEACQSAFDNLATAYIDNSGALDHLTEESKNATIAMLKQQGVANAEELVEARLAELKAKSAAEEAFLAEKKNNSAISSSNLENATWQEISAILETGNASATAAGYLSDLALAKLNIINNPINSDSDINNIIAIANAAGASEGYVNSLRTALVNLQNAQTRVDTAKNLQVTGIGSGLGKLVAVGTASVQESIARHEVENSLAELKSAATGASLNPSNFHSNSSGSSSGSGGSDTAKQTTETAETFDFIEKLLSKLSSAFDKLKSKGENTFLSFTARSKAYSNSLTKVNEQINTLRSASDSYMAKANSFGLEEEWARQMRDGSLNIAEVTDDGLKERIKNYQTWYEKASACNDEIDELSKTQKQLTQSKLELLITKYEQLADKAASANDRIENSISLKESYGGYGSVKDYKNLNKNNRVQIKYANTQINKYKELQKTVKKGSEEWYNYQKKIDSNRASVQKLTQSIFDNAKALAEQSKAKADVKIEKYDASDSLLNAKVGNAISYKNQNKFVNEEIKNITRRQNAYNSAVSTDKAGITSAGRAISKTKTTKENKSLLKKIKPYLKSKKEIPSSLLSQAAKLNDNHLLYQKCVQYNAYVAAYETNKAAADLYKQQGAQEKADLAIQKQDNISKYYGNRQKKYDQKATELNSAIDTATARGYQSSQNYYNTLAKNEKNRNNSLVTEREKLVKSLSDSVKNGSIKKGTDEWYELCQQIDDVTNAINDSNLSLVEYENQIRQIKWDNFDNLQDRIRNITSELDFAINELSREDLASNETGRLTDNGNAVAALHASNYTTYLQQARDYETEISKIEKDIATDPYNQKLLDRRQDLIKSYQDAVTGAQDEKYAIIDLYTKGYDALTNKISDLISEYGKLLDAEKSAYDYQNNIADKTKEIANIRKMLDAYSGDISEEARTKVQSLTVSLADAEKDLKETQYDKYISDTKDMLSGLQEDFEKNIQEIIDSMSQNFGSLMQKIEAESQNSSNVIKKSLEDIGYKSSTEFASILDGSGISKATIQMIADTKNFQDKMTAYADTIANAAKTTNVTNEVNKKIQNEGSKALSTNLADSKKDVSSNKKSYTAQKEKREKAKIDKENAYYSYMDARGRFGKNSTQALQAKKIYEKAKAAYDEANSKYIKIKDNYNDAKVRSTVLDYLNKHLTVTSSSRSSYSDLNKALYDQYGQRVLSNAEILELADILGVKFDNQKSSGRLYQKLKDIGIKGFKVGSRSVPRDQLALLAEEGTELFFDKNQGILHQVGKGDKIFTNADTENLWNWAKMNPVQFSNSLNLPSALSSFEPNINSGDVTIDLGGIVMNGVNDVETFGKQIREEFCKNGKTTKCIVEAVSSEMLGKGIGNARLYR